MENMTRQELIAKLSPVQRKVYRTAKKREIITQIRLNAILWAENAAIEKGGQNE